MLWAAHALLTRHHSCLLPVSFRTFDWIWPHDVTAFYCPRPALDRLVYAHMLQDTSGDVPLS